MDNVTHTLIGAAFARTLPRRFQRPEIYWASVVGNNMPDSDFLMKFFPGTTNLDYLVHHRGYTHTFLLAPVMGTIAAFIAQKVSRTPQLSRELLCFGIVGALFHISADFMNGYGVHPLSPFSNRWFYGDSVYIVEPLIWFVLIPFVALHAERKWAKAAWWLLGFGMLVLVWNHSTVNMTSAIVITAFSCLTYLLYRMFSVGKKQTALVCTLFSLVVGSFFTAGAFARARVKEAWKKEGVQETWLDIVSNPLPGNMFCWSTWSGMKTDTQFIFRSASVSLWPSLLSVEECGRSFQPSGSAELKAIEFKNSPSVEWKMESSLSAQDRDDFRSKSLTFRKLESFARFPYIRKNQDGSAIAGDLRYDRSPGVDFADALIPAQEMPSDLSGPWDSPLERYK